MFFIGLLLVAFGAPRRRCTNLPAPELHKNTRKSIMVCAPYGAKPGERFPVIGYAHGDTMLPSDYTNLFQDMANYGFVVVGFRSCQDDDSCDDGRVEYLEMLKTFRHLDNETVVSDEVPVNMSLPLSIAGHSTGGRTVMVLAALKANGTHFLSKDDGYVTEGRGLTHHLKRILPRIKVVLVDHGDFMWGTNEFWDGEVLNPDPVHFKITNVPILHWTGSRDTSIEPPNSTWRNFADYTTAPERVFVNIHGDGHMEPDSRRTDEPEAFVNFIWTHAFNNKTAANFFYGPNPGILKAVNIAPEGDQNNAGLDGKKTAGYVACSEKFEQVTSPAGHESDLCTIRTRYKWVTTPHWDVPFKCRGPHPVAGC